MECCLTTREVSSKLYSLSSLTLALKNQNSEFNVLFYYFYSFIFFIIIIVINIIVFSAEWNDEERRREALETYARDHAFDPLIPQNWYSQSRDKLNSIEVIFSFPFFCYISFLFVCLF